MQEDWVNDFLKFHDYIITLPNYKYDNIGRGGHLSLDRVNNDKGYFIGNLQWATRQEQAINQRISTRNKSGYKGVHYDNTKFVSSIRVDGKLIYIGRFDNIKEAVLARNQYITNNNLKHAIQ